MEGQLIAPCGMNCRVCVGNAGYTMAGQPRKMRCTGCRPSGKSCDHVKKYCARLKKNEVEYCYQCSDFPCEYIKRLDTKYRQRFSYSTIANLEDIRDKGMEAFLKEQEQRYKCPNCGDVVCVHTGKCYSCWEGSEISACGYADVCLMIHTPIDFSRSIY